MIGTGPSSVGTAVPAPWCVSPEFTPHRRVQMAVSTRGVRRNLYLSLTPPMTGRETSDKSLASLSLPFYMRIIMFVSFTVIFCGPSGIMCVQAFCPREEVVFCSVKAEFTLNLEGGQSRERESFRSSWVWKPLNISFYNWKKGKKHRVG